MAIKKCWKKYCTGTYYANIDLESSVLSLEIDAVTMYLWNHLPPNRDVRDIPSGIETT